MTVNIDTINRMMNGKEKFYKYVNKNNVFIVYEYRFVLQKFVLGGVIFLFFVGNKVIGLN